MAANPRKSVPPQTQSPTRRQTGDNVTKNGASGRVTSDLQSSQTTINNTASNGLSRTASVRLPGSARAAARKPPLRVNSGLAVTMKPTDSAYDDDSRAEHAQLVDDLKLQVQKAEIASEHYQKELEILQMRLNEVVIERNNLENQISEKDGEVEAVHAEFKDVMRRNKELEQAHYAEKAMLFKEQERQLHKEQELNGVIQRLNETIRQKEVRAQVDGDGAVVPRSASFRSRASPDLDPGQFAPSAQLERSPSRNNSALLLQKDQMIESLRLELAEVQIKLAEMEHLGDGRLQEIERQLLDTKMANARLMEDNESFQLLLSEKTLKGDFMHEPRPEAAASLGTLADELETAGDSGEGENSEAYKRLEAELKSSRDSNKALTLYIDKIIGRLLQHEGFEHIIHEKDEPRRAPAKATDKALPPPPSGEQQPTSFLQRAKSVVSGRTGRPLPQARPLSYMPPAAAEPVATAHENPETAPSIPLSRGHRRSRSDQASENPAAAVAVSHKGRGSPRRTSSGGPSSRGTSPSMSPSLSSNRSPFLSSNLPSTRVHSGSGPPMTDRSSRTDSIISGHSGEVNSHEPPSPPRERQGANALPGAVMKQNQLRPLRLVREITSHEDDEAARKRANRASWMPAWFNRPGPVENEPIKPPPA